MENFLYDLKFYRIINGYFEIQIKDQKYKIVYPDNNKKYEAEKLYVSILQDSRFDTEYLNDVQLQKILQYNNVWNSDKQEKIKEIEQAIDKLKIILYKEYSKKDIRERTKEELEILRKYQNDLLLKKHSLDYLTLKFFANNIKNQYLISQCVLTLDDQPVFGNDYQNMDLSLLRPIVSEVEKNQITASDLRAICTGDLWRRYLCSKDIFGPSIHLNDDQINLLSLQKMYDNVRGHPDCPEEDVIMDSDALDGWFLNQKDKVKERKKKNEALSKVRGKVGSHDFIYIMTNGDKEQIQAVESMNDLRGKSLVKSVKETAKSDKKTNWRDVPYIKQELKSQAFKNQKQGVPNQ